MHIHLLDCHNHEVDQLLADRRSALTFYNENVVCVYAQGCNRSVTRSCLHCERERHFASSKTLTVKTVRHKVVLLDPQSKEGRLISPLRTQLLAKKQADNEASDGVDAPVVLPKVCFSRLPYDWHPLVTPKQHIVQTHFSY